jgi:hypothetical protein
VVVLEITIADSQTDGRMSWFNAPIGACFHHCKRGWLVVLYSAAAAAAAGELSQNQTYVSSMTTWTALFRHSLANQPAAVWDRDGGGVGDLCESICVCERTYVWVHGTHS